MSPWISIAERRPEYNARCLVAWDGSNAFKKPWVSSATCAIQYTADGWLWYETGSGDFCEWDTDDVPTHWAPVPAAPEPAEQKASQADSRSDDKEGAKDPAQSPPMSEQPPA